ncbi:MAG: DUF6516 family protein [Acidobacteriaceae bacterium]
MAKARALTKRVDETTRVRCASGLGMIREEVWAGEDGQVAKYNLAFINHALCRVDNGRVLGYDNAHGAHERHFKGAVKEYEFTSYEALVKTFLEEVRALREE